jgi:hypothetical protein
VRDEVPWRRAELGLGDEHACALGYKGGECL